MSPAPVARCWHRASPRSLVGVLRVLLLLVPLVIVVYALVDCLMADGPDVRALPKPVWALAIVVLPVVGAALWFTLGRPARSGRRSGRRQSLGPDDDPGFLSSLRGPKPR